MWQVGYISKKYGESEQRFRKKNLLGKEKQNNGRQEEEVK